MITLIVGLVVIGALLYLFNRLVTIDGRFKLAVNVLVCLGAFLWAIGIITGHRILPL